MVRSNGVLRISELIYGYEGIFESAHILAMDRGEPAGSGGLQLFRRALPNDPRIVVSVNAKRAGGLTVSSDFTSATDGNDILARYRLVLPSSPEVGICRLKYRQSGQTAVGETVLIDRIKQESLDEFRCNLSCVIGELAIVSDNSRLAIFAAELARSQ